MRVFSERPDFSPARKKSRFFPRSFFVRVNIINKQNLNIHNGIKVQRHRNFEKDTSKKFEIFGQKYTQLNISQATGLNIYFEKDRIICEDGPRSRKKGRSV